MSITSSTEGFSLLEVLVALIILAIGLLALAGMQMVSFQDNHSAFIRSQASLCANDILDRMRVNRQSALDEDYDIEIGDAANGTVTRAELDLNAWKSSLVTMLPQGDGSVDVEGTNVTVIIQWQDSSEGGNVSQFETMTQL